MEGFRISAAAILYPVLLVVLMRDSHLPDTGIVTGLFVLLFRMGLDLLGSADLSAALLLQYPGGVFYVVYDCLLCLLLRDRRSASPGRLWLVFGLCDFCSNILNLLLSGRAALRLHSGIFLTLALSIARDVHEVKKDNLRIIRGLEHEVAETYGLEAVSLSDLLGIVESSTRHLLGGWRAPNVKKKIEKTEKNFNTLKCSR